MSSHWFMAGSISLVRGSLPLRNCPRSHETDAEAQDDQPGAEASWTFADDDVRCPRASHVLRDFVAECGEVDLAEKVLSRAEQSRGDREMHLVDESRSQVLANGRDSPAESNVSSARGRDGLTQRLLDPTGDEAEDGPTLHGHRVPGMMRQHEDRNVIRRIGAPPTLPLIVGPRPAYPSEHVAAQYPRAEVLEASRHEVSVDTRLAAPLALQALKRPSRQDPLVQ